MFQPERRLAPNFSKKPAHSDVRCIRRNESWLIFMGACQEGGDSLAADGIFWQLIHGIVE